MYIVPKVKVQGPFNCQPDRVVVLHRGIKFESRPDLHDGILTVSGTKLAVEHVFELMRTMSDAHVLALKPALRQRDLEAVWSYCTNSAPRTPIREETV